MRYVAISREPSGGSEIPKSARKAFLVSRVQDDYPHYHGLFHDRDAPPNTKAILEENLNQYVREVFQLVMKSVEICCPYISLLHLLARHSISQIGS